MVGTSEAHKEAVMAMSTPKGIEAKPRDNSLHHILSGRAA
jgi:hypothetical protein